MVFKIRSAMRREKLRESLWPKSRSFFWPPTENEGGWARTPRTLSVLFLVMDENSPSTDLARTYIDLLARTFEEGIVDITTETEHALLSGFKPTARGVRSWRERIQTLEKLGFIRTKGHKAKSINHVVLVHPILVMSELRKAGRVSDSSWLLFTEIHTETNKRQLIDPIPPPSLDLPDGGIEMFPEETDWSDNDKASDDQSSDDDEPPSH